jgi:hypothetical protein
MLVADDSGEDLKNEESAMKVAQTESTVEYQFEQKPFFCFRLRMSLFDV